MTDKKLINFIKKAKSLGYEDYEIRAPLLEKGWPKKEIDLAFETLKPKRNFKNQVCIYLDDELLSALEKRAKKNMFSINEQVVDIVRRSVVKSKSTTAHKEKLDDMFITFFSRRR